MKMKKFIAPTMKDAVARMKKELGENAVILSNKTTRLSPDGAELVEVIAASEDEAIQAVQESAAAAQGATRQKSTTVQTQHDAPLYQELMQNTAQLVQVRESMDDALTMLRQIGQSMKYRYSASLNATSRSLYESLRRIDFDDEEALRLVGETMAVSAPDTINELFSSVTRRIAESIRYFPALERRPGRQVISFIGSSGSGKTITLSKIAAASLLVHKANILLVSADTYKVGGSEQLQTFAAVAGLPFQAVYTAQDLRHVVRDETRRDFIFVDMPGRNPREKEGGLELRSLAEAASPDLTYLMIPATQSARITLETLERWSEFRPHAAVLTKTDESPLLGQALTSLMRSALPLAYLTTGTRVPNDIEVANQTTLAEAVFPSLHGY